MRIVRYGYTIQDMIKAFISHSHVQKDFALELVEKLGRDYCIIDCYDFQPAYRSMDQILQKIDDCSMFVLLISKESLQSDWVNVEIEQAKLKFKRGTLDRFLPYIIDERVNLEDVPDWLSLRESFNLKHFKSPFVLARDIEQKFRREIWKSNPHIRLKESVMVGRNDDISKFEEKFLSSRMKKLRVLIISGREGTGKETFAKQCMVKIGYEKEFEPYKIDLDVKESVENFIIHLNSIARLYDQDKLTSVLYGDAQSKAYAAVLLLKELYETRSVVFVFDNMSCIQPNRDIPTWLCDVISNPELPSQLGLCIIARLAPNAYIEREHPEVVHIPLQPLSKNDRKKLFYSYAQIYDINDIDDRDVEFFVDKLLQSPEQLKFAVEAIHNTNLTRAKSDVEKLVAIGDSKIKVLLNHFHSEKQRELLIILSKLDFFSYPILERIYDKEIVEILPILEEMMVYGIVSNFGPSDEFFRLDHFVGDYLRRNKFRLKPDMESCFHEALDSMILNSSDITEDVSLYFYEIRRNIEMGKTEIQNYLIPSIPLKYVIDKYNDRDFSTVIKICDMLLHDSTQRYYEEVRIELTYWLCLALCRTQDKTRFDEEVKVIRDAEYWFLKGFFQRIAGNYQLAEDYLGRALDMAPAMQRARREMVTTLLAQGRYGDALFLAKENYEANPDNSYHNYAYFRCLVRKHNLNYDERKVLTQLMDEIHSGYSEKREELFRAMQIDFQSYVNHTPPAELLKFIHISLEEFPRSINVKRAAQDYKYRQGFISEKEDLAEDDVL